MTRADQAARLANTALATAVIPLLERMCSELDRSGPLRRETQPMMSTAYGTLLAEALGRHHRDVRTGQRVAGCAVAAAGTALAGTGMTSFAGPQQLNGGETDDLITGGIYNYSRHPQYAGFVAATAGLAASRGSQRAALLTIELTVIMRAWGGGRGTAPAATVRSSVRAPLQSSSALDRRSAVGLTIRATTQRARM